MNGFPLVRILLPALLSVLVLPFSSTSAAIVDLKKEEAALLEMHRRARAAHFQGDAAALAAGVAPELISVAQGKIKRQTRAEVEAQFREYFRGSNYSAWDDLEPPVVYISQDGMTGVLIVRVHSKFVKTSLDGKQEATEFVCAWTSIFEKQDGKWLMKSVTSTFEPNP